MYSKTILEALWRGDLAEAGGGGAIRIGSALEAILPVRAAFLESRDPATVEIQVMSEATLILPDLSLGDLLAEEIDLFVPDQCLVFIVPQRFLRPDCTAKVLSDALGSAVAKSLIDMAEICFSSADDEAAALASLWSHFCAYNGSRIPAELDATAFAAGFERTVTDWSLALGQGVLHRAEEAPRATIRSTVLDHLVACRRKLSVAMFSDLAVLPFALGESVHRSHSLCRDGSV